MKLIGCAIMFICLGTFSCKTTDVLSPQEYDGNRLLLSHGGGFTGAYTTYCLLDNGQLFKSENEIEATHPVKRLNRKTVDQIFSNYDVLGLGREDIESYGNLNYSIKMISGDGGVHKLNWVKDQEGTEKLQLFYSNIMNQIRLNNSDETVDNSSKAIK